MGCHRNIVLLLFLFLPTYHPQLPLPSPGTCLDPHLSRSYVLPSVYFEIVPHRG